MGIVVCFVPKFEERPFGLLVEALKGEIKSWILRFMMIMVMMVVMMGRVRILCNAQHRKLKSI